MDIRQIDPHDDATFTDWYAALRSGLVAGRTAPIVFAREEVSASLRSPSPTKKRLPFAGFHDGRIVAGMILDLPQAENLDLVEWTLAVPPEHRGHGHGAAMFAEGLAHARRLGRTVHNSEVDVPAGQALEDSPGSRFALAHGFASLHTEDRLVLDLPLGDGELERLRVHSAVAHDDYELITWVGACPDELIDGYAEMRTIMGHEVPTGEIEHEVIVWDVERLRTGERRLAAQGFASITTVARHTSGRFAGYSLMFAGEHSPEGVYQDDTLVLDGDRGHRLGAALKVRNLEELAARFPERRHVHTWNAESNDAMQHINADFGFRAVETMHEFELRDEG
ncbi:GNAT family N-acetyltransferase [Phytomonospora endophytica]|uniref:GNAT superfamily N-acetyltransferase n=1 Tax=Phytomonospora endophytica TaxID=714109 RepID=A0A841FE54_9ACTN|nr:GNAT family N-acetyltransferase [Phytomonospora endophytica]MBB6034546.1 GNAT superfamily N-acetyltransferase [Phytomonospora endophytica]GIG70455.1 GNAT family N-acetyltransferase [Phytomonospora endophytica]